MGVCMTRSIGKGRLTPKSQTLSQQANWDTMAWPAFYPCLKTIEKAHIEFKQMRTHTVGLSKQAHLHLFWQKFSLRVFAAVK